MGQGRLGFYRPLCFGHVLSKYIKLTMNYYAKLMGNYSSSTHLSNVFEEERAHYNSFLLIKLNIILICVRV